MSSDEEFQDIESDYDPSDDHDMDDSFFIDNDDQPSGGTGGTGVTGASSSIHREPSPPYASRLTRSHYQPPPAPLPQQAPRLSATAGGGIFGAIGAAGGFLNPGAFQAGFGGHAFARPPASAFRRQYKAYSTAILEVQQGRGNGLGTGRRNLMFGGKIIMPPSALDELTQLDIEFPVTFEITNPALPDLNTHVGVLEFIAEEGTVNLPQWVMDQLRLNEGDPIRIWGGRYPKGKMIKIQAQSVDFLEVSDPKAVLEQALRNFSCLSANDIIEISYHQLTFRLLIMEITPPGPAISVLDTDLEVDFAAPLGYVEPEYKPAAAAPTMKDKFVIDTKGKQDVDARGSGSNTPIPKSKDGTSTPGAVWEAFKGSGASLGGKRVKGKGVKTKKIEAVDVGSRIIRTDQPRIITADTQIGGRQVPAALNLPFGNLFFGFENLQPPPGSAQEAAQQTNSNGSTPTVPFAGVGSGNTLSGRSRKKAESPAPVAPASARINQSDDTKPKPFSGQGQSLSSRKPPIEVIEID